MATYFLPIDSKCLKTHFWNLLLVFMINIEHSGAPEQKYFPKKYKKIQPSGPLLALYPFCNHFHCFWGINGL